MALSWFLCMHLCTFNFQFIGAPMQTHPAHITVIVYPKQPVGRALQYPYAKAVRRTDFRLVSTTLQSLPRVVQPVQGWERRIPRKGSHTPDVTNFSSWKITVIMSQINYNWCPWDSTVSLLANQPTSVSICCGQQKQRNVSLRVEIHDLRQDMTKVLPQCLFWALIQRSCCAVVTLRGYTRIRLDLL